MSDNPFDPRSLDELPSEIAIFPLSGATLLPGTQLPLNIFEPRYLNMVLDALAGSRMLAMVQPDPGHPESNPPVVYPVGCVGRIIAFNETGDGRLLISLQGVCRFRIAEELSTRRGYRRVRPAFEPYGDDLTGDPAFALDRDELRDAMAAYLDSNSIRIDWDALEKMPDASMVDFLCMHLPLASEEKQALVEAVDAQERVQRLMAVTQMSMSGGAEGQPTRH
jgi:Lon protease-like protein